MDSTHRHDGLLGWNMSVPDNERSIHDQQEPTGADAIDGTRISPVARRPHDATMTTGPDARNVEAIYDAYGPELFRFAFRILQDRNRAEEAVQDTFVRAWRNGERFDERIASVRTWLFSIAHNVCIDAIRARNSRPPLVETVEERTSGTSGEPTLEAAMDSWLVEEALRRIRDDQRIAIVETYLRGRTYAEVSAATGTNEATLRSRVFYGLKALRVALEELGWAP